MDIIVFNLSPNVINSDLLKLFAVYGQVSYVAIVRDPENGRSKGTAFLHMPHEAQGKQAVLALHHSALDGRRLTVQEVAYKAGEFNN